MTAPTVTAARLLPALWVALAVGAAIAASVLVGAALPVTLAVAATRAGMDVAGVGCVGLALVGLLLTLDSRARSYDATRAAQRLRAAADRALVVTAGAWLVAVLGAVIFRAAYAFGRPIDELGAGPVLELSTRLAAGRGMLLAAGCAGVVLGCAVARLRDPDRVQVRIPLVAAMLGLLTPAVTGHAGGAPDHQLAVITVALHVAAAALWVGGLCVMLVLVASQRELLATALPRFSKLAGACVFAVGLTGILNAQFRLPTWGALLTSGYGWLVVAKAVLLVIIGVLGAVARRRLAAGRIPVLRWAGLETALMAAALGVAAALTQTA
jgi:copper resistance protein D